MSRGYAAIGLVAPKCDANVGGALRAAQCYGASLIAIQGARVKRVPSDTTAAERHIPVLQGQLLDLVPHGCVSVAVECVDDAESLVAFAHPERAFYIFGPEDGSVPADLVQACSRVVKVPTRFCMNLAATVNVVLYDRLAKAAR